MIQVQSSYTPLIRKTKNHLQWIDYIKSKLKESRLNTK